MTKKHTDGSEVTKKLKVADIFHLAHCNHARGKPFSDETVLFCKHETNALKDRKWLEIRLKQ